MFHVEESLWIFAVNSSVFPAKVTASFSAEQVLSFALQYAATSSPRHQPSE